MHTLFLHIIYTTLSDEQTDLVEEKEETIADEETVSVGHAMNTFAYVYAVENKNVKEPPLSEDPDQKKKNIYKLRIQGLVFEQELKM